MTQLLSITGTCDARLTSANSQNSIPLLSVPQILSEYGPLGDTYTIGIDFRLESLRAEINLLKTLAKAPFPNFYPEDSVSKKLEKKFEIEENYPLIGLEILKRSASGNLVRLSEIPVQNKGSVLHAEMRMPYLGTGEVKLLGKSDELFCRCNDKGFGTISASSDYIQIEGDYSLLLSGIKREEAQGRFMPGVYGPPSSVPVTDVATQLAEASLENKYLSIHNDGPGPVFLRIGGNASTLSYNLIVPQGTNVWDFRVGSQEVSAIVGSGTSILKVAVATEVFRRIY